MGRIADLRRKVRGIPLGTIWVCQCCALEHANGECCAEDSHGGDGIEPWALWDDGRYRITAGMSWDEHDDGCDMYDPDRVTGSEECDCERRSFSWSSCEGCGSSLGGSRYAHTPWREPQRFHSRIRAIAGADIAPDLTAEYGATVEDIRQALDASVQRAREAYAARIADTRRAHGH